MQNNLQDRIKFLSISKKFNDQYKARDFNSCLKTSKILIDESSLVYCIKQFLLKYIRQNYFKSIKKCSFGFECGINSKNLTTCQEMLLLDKSGDCYPPCLDTVMKLNLYDCYSPAQFTKEGIESQLEYFEAEQLVVGRGIFKFCKFIEKCTEFSRMKYAIGLSDKYCKKMVY